MPGKDLKVCVVQSLYFERVVNVKLRFCVGLYLNGSVWSDQFHDLYQRIAFQDKLGNMLLSVTYLQYGDTVQGIQ